MAINRLESDRESEIRLVEPYSQMLRWSVCPDGYRWARRGRDWALERVEPKADADRAYSPLFEPGLFQQFAALGDDRESALGFANKFGPLGLSRPELHSQWVAMIRDARQALELWQALDDAPALANLIRRDGANWRYVHDADAEYPVCIVPTAADVAHLLATGALNGYLRRHVVPFVGWGQRDSGPTLRLLPLNLAGALWVQFARQVCGEVSYKSCVICRRWMSVSDALVDGSVRINREFCSAACRQKDHRRKVAEARALRAQGHGVAAIARHFQTSTDTIRNWLRGAKP